MSRHLHAALGQFYKMFAEYVDCDLYLAGESYAGKRLNRRIAIQRCEGDYRVSTVSDVVTVTVTLTVTDADASFFAGKYIPSLARLIHDENEGAGVFHVNLKGE